MEDRKQAMDMIDRLRAMFPDKSEALDNLEAELESEIPSQESAETGDSLEEDGMELADEPQESRPPSLDPKGVKSIKNAFSKNEKEQDDELEGDEEDMFA